MGRAFRSGLTRNAQQVEDAGGRDQGLAGGINNPRAEAVAAPVGIFDRGAGPSAVCDLPAVERDNDPMAGFERGREA